jgi:hypothetical protein
MGRALARLIVWLPLHGLGSPTQAGALKRLSVAGARLKPAGDAGQRRGRPGVPSGAKGGLNYAGGRRCFYAQKRSPLSVISRA